MESDLLESNETENDEPTAPKRKGGKKKGKAKAKSNGNGHAKKAKTSGGPTGRPVSEATVERRKKILQMAKRKDGVANIDLAEALGVTTAQSQSLARPLVAAGEIRLAKSKENGRVVYKSAS